MRGPLVSIVMPTLNSAKTIAATLLSIVNQNYRTVEIIIVDDGSTDDTEAVVGAFKDRRIRYERLDQHRGISAALNHGISLASGDLLARMDADDLMLPFRLPDQVTHMLQFNLALVGGGADKFGAGSGHIIGRYSGPEIINDFLVNNPFIHPTMLLDRKQVDIVYLDDFACNEDYELWSKIITETNCGNLTYPVIKYRVSNTSNQSRLEKHGLTKRILTQFCDRFQLQDVPIDALVELQLAQLIRYEDYLSLREYAARVAKTKQPGLGWLQKALLVNQSYRQFTNWHLRCLGQMNFYA